MDLLIFCFVSIVNEFHQVILAFIHYIDDDFGDTLKIFIRVLVLALFVLIEFFNSKWAINNDALKSIATRSDIGQT